MMFSKLSIRLNQIRKKSWSAPTIMTVFILISMIVVFSFEAIGLAKKEKNLELRMTTPEIIIKTISETNNLVSFNEKHEINQDVLVKKLQVVTEKNKELQIEQLMKILIEGANDQLKYQISTQEDVEFFDI